MNDDEAGWAEFTSRFGYGTQSEGDDDLKIVLDPDDEIIRMIEDPDYVFEPGAPVDPDARGVSGRLLIDPAWRPPIFMFHLGCDNDE